MKSPLKKLGLQRKRLSQIIALQHACLYAAEARGFARSHYFGGGTYSLGSCAPEPKKYCCICSTRNCCASGFHGCKRYSFRSILECSAHMRQASALTFS